MFKITEQNIGKVYPKNSYTIYFEYENIQDIVNMVSPCDCSLIYNDKKNNRIKILYTPREIPEHLVAQGNTQLTLQKNFKITYTDLNLLQREELISFTAVVKTKRK